MNFDYPEGATPIDLDEAQRHARLMADVLLVHQLRQERFSWGQENLTNAGECRRRYIDALQTADRHDYGPLLAFVRS